jgi:antirestriction protein
MLAEGIGAFTSQFKKGGMTKKNRKKKLSKAEMYLIQMYAEGGEVDENKAMVMSDNRTIKHHSNELESALKSTKKVPAWVVAKTHKASGDLSDITHYVENKDKFAKGGKVFSNYEIELFWKGLSGDNRNIGKYVVSENTLDKIEEEFETSISIDVIDDSSANPIPYDTLIKEISEKGRSKFGYAKGGSVGNARTKGRESQNWEQRLKEYAGENYNNLTANEREEIISDMKKSYDRNYSYAKGGSINEIKVGDYFINTENGEKFYIDKINKEDKSYPYFVTKSKSTDLGEVISFSEWNRYNKAGLYERVDVKFAKGGKSKTKFSKGDKVIGQFRYEHGEGLRPISLMDYADRVKGVISNVKKIDTTTMYVIDFDNGEQLQYPDFAIDNFIAKSSFDKGGATDPKPSAQDILKRLGYNIPEPAEEVEEEKIIRGWVDDEPYYFAKGGMSKDDSPKVYIADLKEYNDGRLVGKWFDLTDYSDASELMKDIQAMLDEQTKKDKNGEVHEEWAVHDYENFPRSMYSEYMGEEDFQKIIEVIQGAEESNLPFDVILEAMSDLGVDEISEVVERYNGSVEASMGNEWRDFAYEFVDSVGGVSGVSNADYYFDFEAFGRDERINMGGEAEEEMGYEDLSDEQLGEQLVDEIGGVGELDESTIDMYFDYDKFGRELQYDFTSIRGEDGDYYFFNSNYKKGGKLKSKPKSDDDGEFEVSEEDKKIIRGYVDDEPYYFAKGGRTYAEAQAEWNKKAGVPSKQEAIQYVKDNPEILLLKNGGMISEQDIDKMNKLELMRYISSIDPSYPIFTRRDDTKLLRADAKKLRQSKLSEKNFAKGGSVKKGLKVAKKYTKLAVKKSKPILKKGVKVTKKYGKIAIKKSKPIVKKGIEKAKIGFDALVKKVAKRYEGSAVQKKYQELYGKIYSKKEAEEVGRKVASKVYREQQGK